MREARTPDRALVERKRRVRLLLALEGRVLWLPAGLWLLRQGRIVDAVAWQAELQTRGDPTCARSALSADAQLQAVSRQQLASATHALAVLEADLDGLSQTPARWLGGTVRDAAWLAAQRRRVQQLSGWIGRAPRDLDDTLRVWFAVESLPRLDPVSQRLAWLCEHPPTAADALADLAPGAIEAVLPLIAEHGPRDADAAARLLRTTRDWPAPQRTAWWRWLAAGIDPAIVHAWPARQRVEAAPPPSWSLPAVRVYLQLATRLRGRPGAEQLPLLPSNYARLADARQPTLIALAGTLDALAQGRIDAGDRLALADVVLRLDGRLTLPAAPPTPPGLLASVDPDYLRWLGASAAVERYLGLRQALGEPAELSRRLTQDHQRRHGAAGERAVLLALPVDDPRRARLATLDTAGDPARTRRRLTQDLAQLELRWQLRAVDQALQAVLARVIGSATPNWDPAWRDAARLYLGLTHNHTELRGLLRAAARGDATAWRWQLPANRDWLARQSDALQAGWTDPPSHHWLRRDEACTLAAERDPLQALRMGLPFGSCLAIDEGCNRHSAVINAIDANKWVVYLRDPRGRILARQLLAVGHHGGLLGYRIYTSIGYADGLAAAFDDYARDLARACGLALVNAGEPETLNGTDWYDDQPRPWPTGAPGGESELQAYLAELGVRPEGPPAESLAEEARRWAQARAGRVEALPRWGDGSPSGRRNWQLLEARWGRHRLLRMLGPERAGADRLLLADADLATLLAMERQLGPRHRYDWTQRIRSAIPDAEGMRLALRRLHAADAAAGFDDHGVEHAVLDLLPAWAASLSLADWVDALPALARALDHLRAGLPEECRDCADGGEQQLLQALRRAWRSNPDPARLRRLFAARHPSDTLPRWLLDLGARTHLGQPDATPIFAPPAPDRETLRALDALLARHPALRADPLALAAWLRHSDPATLDPARLDWPATPPWSALGDAIVHWPMLWPTLRRYARRPGDLSALTPAEAHWARHTPSAWREALPTLAADPEHDGDRALDALIAIGEPGLIAAARVALARRYPRHRADRRQQQERLARLNRAEPLDVLSLLRHEWQRLDQPGAAPERLAAHPQIEDLAGILLAADTPPRWLQGDPPSWLIRREPRLYASLWQRPAWRAQLEHYRPTAWSAELARQWLRHWPAELGEHWLIRSLQASTQDLTEDGDAEWFRRLAGLAARHLDADDWQTLYDRLPDALAASLFLQARADAPPIGT